MGDLLFNPQGRILKRRFWQGLIILTVAGIILRAMQVHLAPMFGLMGAFVFALPALVLVYVQICIYSKRFHDAGLTGWLIIAVWIGALMVIWIMQSLLGGIFLGEEELAIQAEVFERMMQGESEIALEGMQLVAEKTLPLNIIMVCTNAVIMGLIVGSLKTQPGQNKHGPVPGEEWQDF
ncbi:MAG: DUF805 domain-containing protein [Henriciella sp.]